MQDAARLWLAATPFATYEVIWRTVLFIPNLMKRFAPEGVERSLANGKGHDRKAPNQAPCALAQILI